MIKQSHVALIAIGGGVTVFLLALYGALGAASLALAVVGLGGVFVGLGVLIVSLRPVTVSRPPVTTAGLVALGAALHACEQIQSHGPFSVGWFLWALLPYAVCLLASSVPATRMPSIAATAVVLLADLTVHYDVFVHPTSSTAALALVFIPLWSTLIFAPLTMLVAWCVGRWIRRYASSGNRDT